MSRAVSPQQSEEGTVPAVSIPGCPHVCTASSHLQLLPLPTYTVLLDTEPSGNLLALPRQGLLNSTISAPELSICDFCQGLVKADSLEELLWCHAIRNESLSFALSLLKFKPRNGTGRGSTDNIDSYRRLSLALKQDGSGGYWR